MLRSTLIPMLGLLLLSACGGPEMKDFHLTLIGEMETFPELDTWAPVTREGNAEAAAKAEKLLVTHYADLMDLVRAKSVVALSRDGKEAMSSYDRVPGLADVKLTPVAESADGKRLLLVGVWDELPVSKPDTWRRLMIYAIYERGERKVSDLTVTIRSGPVE